MSKSSTAQIQPLRALATQNSAFGASDYNFRINESKTHSVKRLNKYKQFGQLWIRTMKY